MDDIVQRIILDTSDYTSGAKNIDKALTEIDKNFEKHTKEVKASQKEIGDAIEKESKKVEDGFKKQSNSAVDAVKGFELYGISINKIKEKLSDWIAKLKDAGKFTKESIQLSKGQSESVEKLSTKLGGGAKAFSLIGQGAKSFVGILAASGIGAIVLALGGLVAMLTKTQKGMDFVSDKASYLGGAMNALISKAADVGTGFVKAFNDEGAGGVLKKFGDLIGDQLKNRLEGTRKILSEIFTLGKSQGSIGGAIGQFITGIDQESLKKTVDEMNRAGEASENINSALRAIRRQQKENEVGFASNRAEIEKLKKIGDDTTANIEKRIIAVRKGSSIEQQELNKKIRLLESESSLLVARNRLPNQDNDENKEELQSVLLKIAELRNDSIGKQTELQNMLNALEKENLDNLNNITKTLRELGAEYKIITDQESKQLINEDTIKNLEKFKQGLIDANAIVKRDISKELQIVDILMSTIKQRSKDFISEPQSIKRISVGIKKEIEEIQNEIQKLNDLELFGGIDTSGEREKLEAKIKGIMNNPIQIPIPKIEIKPGEAKLLQPDKGFDIDEFLDGINTAEDLLNKALENIFKDGAKDSKEFLVGISTFVSEFGGLLDEATNLQISQIDKQLEGLDKRREKLEEGLDYERELYEKGLANNLEIKTKEVDAIIEEQQRMNSEKEKLEKEAQRRQILSDAASQGSALITSSINIIKGFSNIPIVGLGLGIAAVATLLGYFAKVKVQSYQATKLYTGTGTGSIKDYFGKIDMNGDTDKNGGKGYRVVNNRTGMDTGVIISARETLLPENISNKYHEVIQGMYLGKEFVPKSDYRIDTTVGNNTKIIEKTIIKDRKGNRLQAVPFSIKGKQGAVFIDMENVKSGDKVFFE